MFECFCQDRLKKIVYLGEKNSTYVLTMLLVFLQFMDTS